MLIKKLNTIALDIKLSKVVRSGFGGFGGGGMNMDDIFSQFGDIFGGGGFGGFGGGRRAQTKGSNLRIRVKLTLEEIANGVEKKIKVKRKKVAKGTTYKTCATCNGSRSSNPNPKYYIR